MYDFLEKNSGFISSCEKLEEADTVIIGIPMDFTVSFKPGTRMGPQHIRAVSYGLEEYSFLSNKDLQDYAFFDGGDLALPFGNVNRSLELIENAARTIVRDNKFAIYLGGEHLVSWPLIKAYADKFPELTVLHFDAHADLRESFFGENNSHATVMRKVCERIDPQNVYQFGIRSGDKAEYEYGKKNIHMFINQVLSPLREVVKQLGQKPVYITLDIDVVDPAFAPGTGTPEPGGCSSAEILEAIISMGSLNIVGMDIVEVSPLNDHSDRTALLAAKIVREAILNYTKPKKMD